MSTMRRVAIVDPVRTPVGKFLGSLAPLEAGALGAVIIKALVERTGVDPSRVDDVVFSQGYGSGEAPAIGRWSWLAAGYPIEVPGFQLDRRCGSGLQAVATAAMMVQTGVADCVLAGGVESMSNVEHYTTKARHGARMGDMVLWDRLTRGRLMSQPIERFGIITGMIETAENLAKDYAISREASDEFAVRSHRNAAAAWAAGKFDAQLVPVPIPQRKGDSVIFAKDEGFREDADMESLGALRPIDGKRDPDAIVTAGNASQQNDAAAACLVVAEDRLEELGLTPMLWFDCWSAAGCDPSRMGIGPVLAVERLFARTGRGWDDIGLIELNEAFAPQALAVLTGWGFAEDDSRRDIVNVNGSGISLGHPIGATGIRILADMAHEMHRRDVRYGLETMCIGGGQGMAAIFERAL
ncbi:acetyl-CoA C-acetyltransferase [Alteriqipengyuania flavescens]|uniref:acetyl-CoA C-acetyltransferase n=1 Tax=Alteriqipengyuania flavescens TaxID=3053610 RepID=UPI0025B4A911|nr:acetyl-CoA C-acetyltransferase [Alteriqipengyuania flavescens]WJY19391.1 acetyl-CoA C-acetyltransferase [Alteriqipengyuania flavescens]WJY25333.1 acetyl-CoA C-acetyltransferase [Alteriqipengyuania flavescens]